jgi:hypothetical protein
LVAHAANNPQLLCQISCIPYGFRYDTNTLPTTPPSTSCHSTPQSPFAKRWTCELCGKPAEVHVRISYGSVAVVCESLTVHKSVRFSKYKWTCVVQILSGWVSLK